MKKHKIYSNSARTITIRMMGILLFINILFLMATSSLMAQTSEISPSTESFEKGKIIEKVTCTLDTTQTYALYLPSTYSADKKWPVLFTFDPGGRATIPVNLFKNAAETYNYIIVCPYGVKNGPAQPINDGMRAVWRDIIVRLSVDKQRIYTAGFSGGARVSTYFHLITGNPIRGIIACGAGLSPNIKINHVKNIPYFGITGFSDSNYSEMINLEKEESQTQMTHRFLYYDAPHQWAPEPIITRAVEWLELQEMKAGTIPKNETLIKTLFEKEIKLAAERETTDEIYFAASDYSYIIDTFTNLVNQPELDKINQKITELKNTKEYKNFIKDEQDRVEKEKNQHAKFYQAFAMIKSSGLDGTVSMLISDMGIKRLEKESNDTKHKFDAALANRLLYSVGTNAIEQADLYITNKDYKRAQIFLEIMLASSKKNIYNYLTALYNIASLYAIQNKTDKALKYLQEAADNGFKNLSILEQDKSMDSLRNTDQYKNIIEQIKKTTTNGTEKK